ncbi:MAG: membrane protein [Chloroflexota bacterium]|nr:DUF389 domain-containing protein [Caldilinea sp.]GIK72150.1 MAG: membrane protein [Chloroflexota bacterium]
MQSSNDFRALARKIGFDPDYLEAFERKMFIEGPQSARRLTNFFVLLLLAATIATYGLLSDSTASVIGAMIVAPLMGPIMATTAAVVMGSAQRTLRSLALVVVGVISVIALSMALSWVVPDVAISFTENGQLASRIAPGLLSLLTALASGAAGAFITAREEIADSMGGVAIAISLVPPLCVVGIALRVGEFGPASGAMMLFITNFLAILLAGGLTFLLGGLGRLAITDENVRTRRRAFAVVIVATLLIAIPLSITTYNVVNNAFEERAALQEVDAWLDGANYHIIAVNVNDRRVVVTVDGSGETRPLKQLAGALAQRLGRPIVVNLRIVPSQIESSD